MTVTATRQRLNRALVIELAAVIADSEGIDAVTLQRIANDSGVKQPALYRHVSGIEDLWKELALRARRLLAESLMSAHVGLERTDAVRAVAQAWRRFVRTHPGLYSATDRVPSVGDGDIEKSLSLVIDALVKSLSSYNLSNKERAQYARTLRSSLHGFCVLEKDHGHPEPLSVDAGLDHLVEILCCGFEAFEKRTKVDATSLHDDNGAVPS